MELGVTIGLFGVLAAIAGFLCYFISRVLNFEDARKIDKIPEDLFF